MTVYIPWNTGLGDHIATIQLLLKLAGTRRGGDFSAMKANEVLLSALQNGVSYRKRMEEIIDLMATSDLPFRLVDEPGDTELDGFNVWATAPFKQIYDPWYWRGVHTHVTYQFDGISSPQKNPPPEAQRLILDRLRRVYGFDCIPLDRGKTLHQCTDLLATSHFFVGCDSGMSHLAHMAGVPLFLLEYDLPVVTCHRGKPYIHCNGAGDFLDNKLPTYMNYRKFLGLA